MTNKKDTRSDVVKENEKKANRDPVSGEVGMHAVGTGLGAAVGGTAAAGAAMAAGATMGSAAGPAGAIIGAAVGAVIGADAGNAIGEKVNPTQLVWWEENYSTRPYVRPGEDFAQYEPAYRSGLEAARKSKGKDFQSLAPSIENNWNLDRGDSQLEWDDARPAVEDAFQSYVKFKPGMDAR
ncbi:MAG: hypothetical protein PW788_06125 [Micavibrio sp.]|nr:hypothetical protein [Micavibrio sp.]